MDIKLLHKVATWVNYLLDVKLFGSPKFVIRSRQGNRGLDLIDNSKYSLLAIYMALKDYAPSLKLVR